MSVHGRVCVFCGSSDGASPRYVEAARATGRAIAERGLGLVYGGAAIGTMGAVADAALEAGGEVIGVMPRSLADREIAHRGLTELHVVEGMHERKALMTHLSQRFVALPGGLGTLDELFEAMTWAWIGIHDHPIGLVDVDGYWGPLLHALDHFVEQGFVRKAQRDRLRVATSFEALLEAP